MGKAKVIATAMVHLVADGAYRVSIVCGTDRKDMQGLSLAQVQIALGDIAPLKNMYNAQVGVPIAAVKAVGPDEQAVRMECVRLLLQADTPFEVILSRAQKLAEWILGHCYEQP